MDMWKNILLSGFKGEKSGPTYYLLSEIFYGVGIHDDSNNICSVYTWTEFEGENEMNNIAYFLLLCLNDKGYYSQSYGKNNKAPEIAILVDNCGGKNKNNVIIIFLNIIKEGGFSGTDALKFYMKGHTKNDCDRAFNSLKVLYWKQNVFTFEKCCDILSTR